MIRRKLKKIKEEVGKERRRGEKKGDGKMKSVGKKKKRQDGR